MDYTDNNGIYVGFIFAFFLTLVIVIGSSLYYTDRKNSCTNPDQIKYDDWWIWSTMIVLLILIWIFTPMLSCHVHRLKYENNSILN